MIELCLSKSLNVTIERERVIFKLVSLGFLSSLLDHVHNFTLSIRTLDICYVAEKPHHVFKFRLGIIYEIFKSSEQAWYSTQLCVKHYDFKPVFNMSCSIFDPIVPILRILFFAVKLDFAYVISSVPQMK